MERARMVADRAALYLELHRRRRRAVLMARRALAIAAPVATPVATPIAAPVAALVATPIATPIATPVAAPVATPIAAASKPSQRSRQDCSNGSFHCAVSSSRAAEAAIGSTDMSAA